MPTLDYEPVRILKINRRKLLIELLGGSCINCGGTEKLEFDHIMPDDMSFRIGHRTDYSLETLLPELQKCQLLCKKCHYVKTISDRNYSELKHGTRRMYLNHGCRCPDCREANTVYCRNRRYNATIILTGCDIRGK